MNRPSGKRLAAILTIGAAAYLVGSMYQPTVVVGDSMAPTLNDGRVIYVDRMYYQSHPPRAGEVVVFDHGDGAYVKRVYRGPGEWIHYVGDRGTIVQLISETQLEEARKRYSGRHSALCVESKQVPKDSVWVLGDNFNRSEDSRNLGPIPIRELIGRARVPVDTTIASQYELRPRSIPFRPHTSAAWRGAAHRRS